MANNPEYPDMEYYLNATQKYFFRSAKLLHLRVEQVNRYFTPTTEEKVSKQYNIEAIFQCV